MGSEESGLGSCRLIWLWSVSYHLGGSAPQFVPSSFCFASTLVPCWGGNPNPHKANQSEQEDMALLASLAVRSLALSGTSAALPQCWALQSMAACVRVAAVQFVSA